MANRDARIRTVEEHVRCENEHDLAGLLQSFGTDARYDDEPWDEHHEGPDGVRGYYETLLQAVPDLHIDVRRRHVTDETIVLEVIITGTHLGPWRGLPGTGRRLEFPLCGIYTFDADDRLNGEKIYYDRATVLRQIGMFHEPFSGVGSVVTPLTHPVTMARAIGRSLFRRNGHTPA
ncbi:MAG TPA: ester cyclase [Polyangia bacterium]|nr:ester cyclase [Polyangia bacterium]